MGLKVRFNASVVSQDQQTVGKIKEIVLDPQTHDVLSIVVKQGLFFEEDQLLPFDLVDSADEECVYLNASVDELNRRSRVYNQEEFASLGARGEHEELSQKLWMRPLESQASIVPPGVGPITPPEDVPIPSEDIGLLHGSQVYDVDNKNVGTVKGLMVTEDGTTTHLLLSEGTVFPMPKLVPLDWVTTLTDTQVILGADAAALEQLPDYGDEKNADSGNGQA